MIQPEPGKLTITTAGHIMRGVSESVLPSGNLSPREDSMATEKKLELEILYCWD